jgi:hypothetical protein
MSRCDRQIVVDADVLQSAGEGGAAGSRQAASRDFLQAFLEDSDHCAVRTPELWSEWTKHWSKLARIWYRSLEAKKRVIRVTPTREVATQVAEVEATAPRENDRLALAKDGHLMRAALSTDRRIVSFDETVRQLAQSSCKSCKHLREVIWVNPNSQSENALGWLRSGAPDEPVRRLGGKRGGARS